jgi:hypothetical protein
LNGEVNEAWVHYRDPVKEGDIKWRASGLVTGHTLMMDGGLSLV